jgi:hypothetical protein
MTSEYFDARTIHHTMLSHPAPNQRWRRWLRTFALVSGLILA